MAGFSERADFISMPEHVGLALWLAVKVFLHYFGFSFLGKTQPEITASTRKANQVVQTFLFTYLPD